MKTRQRIGMKRMISTLTLLLAVGTIHTQAATYYVATTGSAGNDGTTWAAAVASITNGIAKAVNDDDTVLVSNGIYSVTTGLSVWLRADTGVLTNGTGQVTNWQDQATSDGSHNAVQGTTALSPQFVVGGLNGQPVVRFNGTDQSLLLGDLSSLFTTEATLFVVATVMTLDQNYNLYSTSGNSASWSQGFVGPFYSGNDFEYRYNQYGSFGNYPEAPRSGSHIMEFLAGSDYTEFTDGTSLGTLNSVNTASDSNGGYKFKGGAAHILGGYQAEQYFGGDVAEVLIYNRVLTANERNQVGVYLQARYGISGNYFVPPAAPSNLTATAISSSRISLSWTDNSSETGFKVERATDSGFIANLTLVTTTAANATNYTDSGLSPVTTYYYRVCATNPAGVSGYSTPANATTLPPRVSDSLSVWLRGDVGILTNGTGQVTNWQDQATSDGSGSQNATQTTAANQPAYVASASGLNNQPVIRFDGVKDSTGDRLLLGNLSSLFTTEATFFVVYSGDSTLGLNYSVYSSGPIGGTYWDQGKVGPFYGATDFNYRYNENGSFGNYPDIPCAGNHIVAFRAGSDYTVFTNGVSLGTLTVANTATDSGGSYTFWGGNDHRIGNDSAHQPLNFRGDVAEIIIYNRKLNAAARVIVENRLSARYGLLLGANDVYTGDNAAKGDYDFDVVGIGNMANDAVAPGKVSTSDDGGGLQLGELNASLDVNGEFLVAGHNVGTNSWSADMSRWNRVWYLDKVGTVDATLTFDFSDAGLGAPAKKEYVLLFSTDNTFSSFGKVATASTAGNQVSFNLVDAQLKVGYYTIGWAAAGTVIMIR